MPHFAVVTQQSGLVVEYPEVGCSPERPECCAYPLQGYAYLQMCPKDYFSTAGGCCPL